MNRALLEMGRKQRLLCLRQGSEDDWHSLAEAAEFDVNKFADLFGLSTRQMERLVQARFKLPPRDFLLRERMRAARSLLPLANSIKEISFKLGYTHPPRSTDTSNSSTASPPVSS